MTAAIDTDSWSEWPAPAKLNLFLRITGRRADGFHNVQTVFQLLDWGDTIRLRVRTDRAIIRHSGNDAVPEAADLAVRAAQALQEAGGGKLGCDIAIDKRIPLGGGFGGGSSDAATVLVALNHLWKAGLSTDQLATLGRTLGADVPIFVHGHNAWAEGIGDELQPLALPPAWYVIGDPGIHVPTATLFLAPDLTRDAQPVTIRDFTGGTPPGSTLENAFEPVLRRREPAIAAALDALSVFGSARVTGSGSGCFVAFADRDSAQVALESLPPGLRGWIAKGASRSPLLDRLE